MHDEKTEVLTKSGWKPFKILLKEDLLATINPLTSELVYEKPTEIICEPYSGNLVCAKNKFLDFKISFSHPMIVRKWIQKDKTMSKSYSFINIDKIGWYSGFMNNIIWKGSTEASEKFIIPGVPHKHKPQRYNKITTMKQILNFLGIYLAEGTMCEPNKIQIACSKLREKTFIRKSLKYLNLNGTELKDRITFESKQVYMFMRNFNLEGVHAPFKFVPKFVFEQTSINIKHLLLGHFMGDGCMQRGLKSHYTSSFQLADDLQLLIFLSGSESVIGERPPRTSIMKDGRVLKGKFPEYRISVCEKKNLSIDRKKTLFKEKYKGFIYTARVPTYHTLVTRRNKKILISGDC